ncbi:MAG: molybdopterin-dependent oxidoreductase, partial [Deltaproteobacteria bacterium]|nr:molybdopterin-dependent oxidoreductase [Deltaproteobacteria bacterium]
EKVITARRAVLEFLLINHPLDCTICDQSGECKLQDYCFEHGQAASRFTEEKNTYPQLEIGPDISRNMNRCIHCTRCIRYMRDIVGDEVLALSERGHHTTVGPYLEKDIPSEFSLNLANICPVGALTSRHFRFKGRAWLMKKTRTLCAGCARGCNVFAWACEGKILRLTPAENDLVNKSWLCNPGYLSITDMQSSDRILKPTRSTAVEEAAAKIKAFIDNGQAAQVAVLASPRLTNEDNFAIAKLAREVIGTESLAVVLGPQDPRPFDSTEQPLPEWFIRADKNPNSHGANDMINTVDEPKDARNIIDDVASGAIRAMLIFSENPETAFSDYAGLIETLENLDFLLVVDQKRSKTAELATLLVPEASFAEKDGTFTNEQGRIQKLQAVIEPRGDSQSAWQTAQQLAGFLGAAWKYKTAADISDEIAAKIPGYQELNFDNIPAEGIQLQQAEPEAAKESEATDIEAVDGKDPDA